MITLRPDHTAAADSAQATVHFTESDSIIDRFHAVARLYPSHVAIQDTANSLTYAELADRIDRIAAATIALTKGLSGPVALLLPADIHLPVAMLGVLSAGRAYVTLDAEHPIERNELIGSEAGACAVITCGRLVTDARRLFPAEVPVTDAQDLPPTPPTKLDLRPRPDDMAAVYYTSGSSGTPKGVAWSHRTLLKWISVFSETARVSCSDRTVLLFSPSVSASYRSIYCALLNGASLHMLPPLDLGVAGLVEQIRARGISIYHSVPTLMRRIAESLDVGERLDSVRIVCIGGDRVQWSDIDECRRCFSSDTLVYSILSSTEAGPCIHAFVDEALRSTTAHPPAGRPAAGWKVTIVDDDNRPVADGEAGSIVVTSRYIALGYWQGSNREVLGFPSDPNDPKQRVFNSGDRGRRRADGLIEFIGRDDQRIKLHGHRIEPAEIESALAALPTVSDAAIVVRRGDGGAPQSLIAYVVLQPGIRGLLPRHLKAMLAQRLPRHMVPAQIRLMSELPRLLNLKIDRHALAQLDASFASKASDDHEAKLIAEITELFEEMIGVKGATPEDTIASLGGDSLQEINVVSALESRYSVKVPDDLIELQPSIRFIASWLEAQVAQSA